jgi:quercetin dioxygenase-like cupin family protein
MSASYDVVDDVGVAIIEPAHALDALAFFRHKIGEIATFNLQYCSLSHGLGPYVADGFGGTARFVTHQNSLIDGLARLWSADMMAPRVGALQLILTCMHSNAMERLPNGALNGSLMDHSIVQKCLVRFADSLSSCGALLQEVLSSTSTPHRFSIVGDGALVDAPHVGLKAAHPEFSISGLRQSFGTAARHYLEPTAEVLIVHSGHWRLLTGPSGEHESLELNRGDVISIPPQVYRGLEKLDAGWGIVLSVLGKDAVEPTETAVFESGDAGWQIIQEGWSIDASSGEARLRQADPRQAAEAAGATEAMELASGSLARYHLAAGGGRKGLESALDGPGVAEVSLVSPRDTGDGFAAGPVRGGWPHGFSVRQLTMQSCCYVPLHSRQEAEVLFVHEGTLEVSWSEGAVVLGAGDTLSVPVGLPHAFRNATSMPNCVFVVRGSEDPRRPSFLSLPAD